jgi:hypothetical protein
MNEPFDPPTEPGDVVVPRWIQIPIGVALGAVLAICLAGSMMMVFLPNEKAPVLAPLFGIVMALTSLWAMSKCLRLITGKRVKGGLIGPRALRTISWLFLLLPVGGLFSGYFISHTLQAVLQTIAYVSFFFGIRVLAAQREKHDA